jgi:magnesium transporter
VVVDPFQFEEYSTHRLGPQRELHFRRLLYRLAERGSVKRKASAFKKVLRLTLDLMSKLIMKAECSIELFQESRDRLERSLFYAEDVHENIQSLLNLHLSVESQKINDASFRTNEIMRVLTVLTIFFLPLNFIAGVFGMNFREMPLLESSFGFWESLALMIVISAVLGLYLRSQGWLDKPEIRN